MNQGKLRSITTLYDDDEVDWAPPISFVAEELLHRAPLATIRSIIERELRKNPEFFTKQVAAFSGSVGSTARGSKRRLRGWRHHVPRCRTSGVGGPPDAVRAPAPTLCDRAGAGRPTLPSLRWCWACSGA